MKTSKRASLRAAGLSLRRWVPTLALGLVAAVDLVASPAAAGMRSHTRHTTVTALPVSNFAVSDTPHVVKKHKGTGREGSARAGSQPSSASRGGVPGKAAGNSGKSGTSSKGRRGRSRQAEPEDDPIPMLRAARRAPRRPGSHDSLGAQVSRSGRAWGQGQRSSHEKGHAPVLVDASGRPVSRGRFRAMRAAAPTLRWPAARSPESPAAFADAHAGAFTEGYAHPEEDERVARANDSAVTASIGSAVVMTADTPHRPVSVPAPAQVVQGFGAEVALASDPGGRPGGTRRRDHPVAASALPGMVTASPLPAPALPATLEERDAITEAAVSPAVLPDLYDHDGRLLMPAPLKGSREVLIHQNTMAANDGLRRIQNDAELDSLRAEHALVAFPLSAGLRVNEELPYNRRCARPWTVLFATDLARDFYERFHQPLVVTSAVRTVSYQVRLQRVNGNAAATDGDAASPHLTGQAIDFGKRGMGAAQLAWMRAYLLPLMTSGRIDVEEEFQQACFHISVYRRYAGGRSPVHEVAQAGPAQSAPTGYSQDTP